MNNAIFLIDPAGNYPFARVEIQDDVQLRSSVAAQCAWHFEKPVKHVSTLYYELHNTLRVMFKDGSDVFIDVDHDEPEAADSQPF